jgi:hypothetical protein
MNIPGSATLIAIVLMIRRVSLMCVGQIRVITEFFCPNAVSLIFSIYIKQRRGFANLCMFIQTSGYSNHELCRSFAYFFIFRPGKGNSKCLFRSISQRYYDKLSHHCSYGDLILLRE